MTASVAEKDLVPKPENPVRQIAGMLAVLALFLFALYGIHHLLAKISYHQMSLEIQSMPRATLALSVLFTALSFVALIGYDWSAMRYVGRRIPLRRIALGSFCGYAIGNSVGLGMVTGGAVRYRIYTDAGLEPAEVAQVAVFCAMAFGIGISALGAAATVWQPDAIAHLLQSPPWLVRGLGVAALAALTALLATSFYYRKPVRLWRWELSLPSGPIVLGQLAVSVLDLAFSAAALHVLLPASIPYGEFVVVYCLAISLGVISHVPGGLGVFEGIVLFSFGDRVAPETLAAALIVYRVVYFLLPLVVAAVLLAVNEVLRGKHVAASAARTLGGWGGRAVPNIVAGLVFLSGLVLLVSSATPEMKQRLAQLEELMPIGVVELSHMLSAIVGLALLFLARGLQLRVQAAFWVTLAMLASGAVASLAKGVDYEEAIIMAITALIMLPCRGEFYRNSPIAEARFSLGWFLAIAAAVGGTIWILLFSFKHVDYANELWWRFAFEAEAPRSLRATAGASILAVALGLWYLFRTIHSQPLPPTQDDIDAARKVIQAHGRADGNLVLLGDKSILFNEDRSAFLMYGLRGRSWVSMGDPVGSKEACLELAWRFREMADQHGGRCVFYQVRAENLPLYLDLGLAPLKLGEEARIALTEFDIQASALKDMRYMFHKAERDGLTVEIFPRGTAGHLMEEMKVISDAWLNLKNTREKRFSMGAFVPDFVSQFDIAVVRHHGRMIAFASLFVSGRKEEASVDLMRHLPEAPRQTMHYLFLKLILHFKSEGFRHFVLGMAPMSGFEPHKLASAWHRIGNFVYQHGEQFYNFKGLRQFKNKFDPIWEPRYLACSGRISPLLVLADIAAMIGGGLKGVIAR